MNTKSILGIASLAIASAFLNGCGSSAGSSASLSSALSDLSQIPDAATMVKSNGRLAIHNPQTAFPRLGFNLLDSDPDLHSVVGDPPVIKNISATNYDGYFWNGLVTQIGTPGWFAAQTNKPLIAQQFWGQDTATPGPGGHGACNMAMNTVEALARMMENAGTMCYMKNITTVTSAGVSVTGSSKADAFKQTAENKIVQVNVSNMPAPTGRSTSMKVFFTIKGSNTVSADKYAYSMYMCDGSTVRNKEELEVDKSTGVITMSSEYDETFTPPGQPPQTFQGKNVVSAFLTTNNSGEVLFDTSRTRTAVSNHQGSFGTYKGQINISGDNLITSKRIFSSAWGSNKDFSISSFSGTGVDDLKFREAAYKGISAPSALRLAPHEYSGVTEFRTDHYVSVASSDISTSSAFTDLNLATDAYFTATSAVPAMDKTGLDCNATADVTINMDFNDDQVEQVGLTCEAGKMKDFKYDLCHGTAVQNAMSTIWSSMVPPTP